MLPERSGRAVSIERTWLLVCFRAAVSKADAVLQSIATH